MQVLKKNWIPLYLIMCCGIGFGVWLAIKQDPQPSATTTAQTESSQEWQDQAATALGSYLSATSYDERIKWVTPTKETRVMMRRSEFQKDPQDVVSLSGFTVKTLPKSFEEHGVLLMYYQRPSTLPNDAVFRPIVPMRVSLAIDSPEPLDQAAKEGYRRRKLPQNVCAFFKLNENKQLTLDWPVFVQTRYRLVQRHFDRHHPHDHTTFRLMVRRMSPTILKHNYQPLAPDHDWYIVHCPGYDQERHPIAVKRGTHAATILEKRFRDYPVGIHAITAQIGWLTENGQPLALMEKIHCFEFFGLNN